MEVTVAMKTLMKCLETEEVRGGSSSCGGTFTVPVDCSNVIMTVVKSVFARIQAMTDDIVLHDGASKF